jgi:hypothetical protein
MTDPLRRKELLLVRHRQDVLEPAVAIRALVCPRLTPETKP